MTSYLILVVLLSSWLGSLLTVAKVDSPSPSNDDYTSAETLKRCTAFGKVNIYIKNRDGSFSHLERLPWDLLCAALKLHGQSCVWNEETQRLEPDQDFQNLVLNDFGMYGIGSTTSTTFRRLIVFRTKTNHSDPNEGYVAHGCHGTMTNDTIPENEPWLALIQRGECFFTEKLENAVNTHGAKGFIMYTGKDDPVVVMNITTPDLTTIMVNFSVGNNIEQLDALLTVLPLLQSYNNYSLPYTNQIYANVSFDRCQPHSGSKTDTPLPVTIVTITFVVVMIVALAWLVVYYFQKHRNANKQAILRVKLQKASKKALKKIGERVISETDKEANVDDPDDCTYCLERLQVGETIRELPCGHKFHKSCVDNWLIHNRTCPNCHGNILLATGVTIRGLKSSVELEEPGNEMLDMTPDNGRRQLLSDSEAIAGYADNRRYFGSQVIPGSQLLTDGQTMFLFVPNDIELPSDTTIQIDNPPPHLLQDPVLTASQQLQEPTQQLQEPSQPQQTQQQDQQLPENGAEEEQGLLLNKL